MFDVLICKATFFEQKILQGEADADSNVNRRGQPEIGPDDKCRKKADFKQFCESHKAPPSLKLRSVYHEIMALSTVRPIGAMGLTRNEKYDIL